MAVAVSSEPTEQEVAPAPKVAPEADNVAKDACQTEAGATTDRLVAWKLAMLESWPDIAESHKRGSIARHAMQWLKKHGPRDVFPAEQPDLHTLRWIDLSGNPQTVSLKRLGNVISERKST